MVDFVCMCVYSAAVKPVCQSLKAGDPAVGMAIEVGTLISEDDVWQLGLGVHLPGCFSGYNLRQFVGAIPLCVSGSKSLGHPIGRLLFFQNSDRESLVVEKVGALSLSRQCLTRGFQFEESRPRPVPLVVPLLAECLRECSSIEEPEECHLPSGTCLFGAC